MNHAAPDHDGVLAIPANEYRRSRWSNGLGWTREILAVAAGSTRLEGRGAAAQADGRLADGGPPAWDLRLSIAEIDAAAGFSSFPGVEREQVLLSGNGLGLVFEDGGRIELMPPHQRARFAGARAVTGVPLDGPAHVFNLMWRPDALEATLLHRPLVGGMWCFCDAHTAWAVHLLAGQARIDGGGGRSVVLAQGDSAWLAPGPDRPRHCLDGGGELLLVRVRWPGGGEGPPDIQ